MFTYSWSQNPNIAAVRVLIGDTDEAQPIFQDEEITGIMQIIVPGQLQSGMFWSTPGGPPGGGTLYSTLPQQPIPYYRIAAICLNSMASNKAALASLSKLLDVSLDSSRSAAALRALAKDYLELEDNSGAFVLIEQTANDFAWRDRIYKQYQRQSAGLF